MGTWGFVFGNENYCYFVEIYTNYTKFIWNIFPKHENQYFLVYRLHSYVKSSITSPYWIIHKHNFNLFTTDKVKTCGTQKTFLSIGIQGSLPQVNSFETAVFYDNSIKLFVRDLQTTINTERKLLHDFSSNSEAFASELLEKLWRNVSSVQHT